MTEFLEGAACGPGKAPRAPVPAAGFAEPPGIRVNGESGATDVGSGPGVPADVTGASAAPSGAGKRGARSEVTHPRGPSSGAVLSLAVWVGSSVYLVTA